MTRRTAAPSRIVISAACLALAACAQYPEDVAPAYVSSAAYINFSCEGLAIEAAALEVEEDRLAAAQQARARGDRTGLGAGAAWRHSADLVRTNANITNELADVRGKLVAIDLAATSRNCR